MTDAGGREIKLGDIVYSISDEKFGRVIKINEQFFTIYCAVDYYYWITRVSWYKCVYIDPTKYTEKIKEDKRDASNFMYLINLLSDSEVFNITYGLGENNDNI